MHLLLNRHRSLSFSVLLAKLMIFPGLNLRYQISCNCQKSGMFILQEFIENFFISVKRILLFFFFKQVIYNDYTVYPLHREKCSFP